MVDPCADGGIITHVYRLLAKRFHPDRVETAGAEARMVELNAAYAILGDPDRREQYDRSIGFTRASCRAPGLAVITIEPDASQEAVVSPPSTEPESPHGEAGPPPVYPTARGPALSFGRYKGWAISQIDHHDRNYLEWLRRTPIGRGYASELDAILGRPAGS